MATAQDVISGWLKSFVSYLRINKFENKNISGKTLTQTSKYDYKFDSNTTNNNKYYIETHHPNQK